MLLCCTLWHLVFVRVSTVPINHTQEVTAHSPVLDLPLGASAEILGELREDMTVQEGDILIPEDKGGVQAVWSGAIVPYVISDEMAPVESKIYAAFKMIADFTCIRFLKRTTEPNYLKFMYDSSGCASFVGCQGGAQPVYYSSACGVGNICHEIIHALGFYHEHTRKDRDQYITVLWQNIIPGKKHNFEVKNRNTLGLPYDLKSIMHYGMYFFSIDGKSPTVLPKQKGVQIGQRTHLSQLDIQKLNDLYQC